MISSRRSVLVSSVALGASVLSGSVSANQSPSGSKEQEVAAAVESLRQLMMKPSKQALEDLACEELSYGHSGGRVDNRDVFVSDLVNGTTVFSNVLLTDQSIKVVGSDLAIVRHNLTSDIVDKGNPGKVNLKILGVWQRRGGSWRLLARQAVRSPNPA